MCNSEKCEDPRGCSFVPCTYTCYIVQKHFPSIRLVTHKFKINQMLTMNPCVCVLCGEDYSPEEVKSEGPLDPTVIIKATFRALGIQETFPLLDEESGLIITINEFCSLCIERSLILNQLFDQIDALFERVSKSKEDLSKYFEGLNCTSVSKDEFEDVRKKSKLRRFVFEKMFNTHEQVPDDAEAVEEERVCINDKNLAMEVPQGDGDLEEPGPGVTEDTTANETDKVKRTKSGNSQLVQGLEEVSKSVKDKIVEPNAFVRVTRLTVKEIEKYTEKKQTGQNCLLKQRTRKKKENPCKLGRLVKKVAKDREDNESKFVCPFEDCRRKAGYESELLLEGHVGRQHKGLTHPYICKECGRKFRQPGHYTLHLKTHEGDYPFLCNWCGVGFTSIWALKMHETKHTGELKFKCKLCPKAYRGHNGLKFHVRMVHTNDKPYFCESCGKAFVQMDKLKRHIQSVHETDKPWVCEVCGKRFRVSNYLYMHKKSVHEGHSFNKVRLRKLKLASGLANQEDIETNVVVPVPENLPGPSHKSVISTKSLD